VDTLKGIRLTWYTIYGNFLDRELVVFIHGGECVVIREGCGL
jgi:hypothetical protein